MKKPRLYLVNGPLGAGKTTFLRYLLSRPEFTATRVIENEFASVSIDTVALHDHTAEVQTIAGVCICCSSGDELVEALMSLAGSEEPVIIEATGVANSLQLVEKLVLGDILDLYYLAQAIFVLDGAEATKEQIAEYKDELAAADIVLVSKLDLLDETKKQALLDALSEAGIHQVMPVVDGVVELDFLRRPSNVLQFFANHAGDLQTHDNSTNYTVIALHDPVEPDQLQAAWRRVSEQYALRRMKGSITDRAGLCWHIEATPAQLRTTRSSSAELPQLVFIGGSARELTLRELQEALQ